MTWCNVAPSTIAFRRYPSPPCGGNSSAAVSVSVQQCTPRRPPLPEEQERGAYVDERLTIYQWASIWTAEDVEERIRVMVGDWVDGHQLFIDTNLLVGAALHKGEANCE